MYDFEQSIKFGLIVGVLVIGFLGCLLGGVGTMFVQWVMAHVTIVAR